MSRLFIAIDLPDTVRERIADICFGIRQARWVASDQLHLTLRFLGETPDCDYQLLTGALADIHAAPFEMTVRGAGFFPPRKNPNVLWVGIEPNGAVTDLYGEIEETVVSCGFEPDDRKFHPHITVARFNERAGIETAAAFTVANALFKAGPFTVSAFHLYSSDLKPWGAIHTREASFPLDADA